jgi:hypothetical protein
MRQAIKFVIFIAVIGLLALQFQADDKELFMGLEFSSQTVRPNVLILMDNSGSMNTVIYYPKNGVDKESGTSDDGYDPLQNYSGWVAESGWDWVSPPPHDYFDYANETWSIGRWYKDGNATYPTDPNGDNNSTHIYEKISDTVYRIGTNGWNYFNVGEKILAASYDRSRNEATCVIKSKYEDGGSYYFEVEDVIGGPITADAEWAHICFQRKDSSYDARAVKLYGVVDNDEYARYTQNYIDWIFCHATDFHRAAISHFSVYGTFDVDDTTPAPITNCQAPGLEPDQAVFTRIQVAREVLCHVATSVNTVVNLGLYKFNTSGSRDEGAEVVDELADMSEEVSLVEFRKKIYGQKAETWTPLAEALADTWDYYKPGPESNDGSSLYPVKVLIENDQYAAVPNPSGTPVEWWCQNNYVVLMTDGESTMDRWDGDTNRFDGSMFADTDYPVKRTEPWDDWTDGWGDTDSNEANDGIPADYNGSTATYCKNYTCWYTDSGSDYLDDVAYLMRHTDMFPEDPNGLDNYANDYFPASPDHVEGMPGNQCIYTYVIGFNADNDMLRETAINGDGVYYTATDYQELVTAFEAAITSILLRNFAFSAITAPKKTASIQTEGVSYIGYFMPSQAASIWEGHLLSHRLYERWGFDSDDSGVIEFSEMFDTETECLDANPGEECIRLLELAAAAEWDAATMMANRTGARSLYTYINDTMTAFSAGNAATIQPYMGAGVDVAETEDIIDKLNENYFADVFHSDIAFVGPPLLGKKYITNINPVECTDPTSDPDCYQYFHDTQSSRDNVLYVGTNDGVLHMIDAENGEEEWGFVPDEILPSLATIVLESEHTYTVDGRIHADDIFYRDGGTRAWKSIVVFGLRRGGRAFYGLDVTNVSGQPSYLWKFKESTYSGQSFGKPVVGQVALKEGEDIVRRWVVFLAGGFEFNQENTSDPRGKAVFMVDASTGELLWMIGYNNTDGAEDGAGTTYIDTNTSDSIRYLTKMEEFNYPVASALTVVDSDSDGLVDTMYFGNIGGHLFRTDVSGSETANWHTTLVYRTDVQTLASGVIGEIVDTNVYDLGGDAADFEPGWTIRGTTSNAMGYITDVDGAKKEITVAVNTGTFLLDETVVARSWDPIYLQPSVAFDPCYQLWVTWGTGDRDRPRTSPFKGRFMGLRDANLAEQSLTNLLELTWVDNELASTGVDQATYNGWYFDFIDDGEKLFDPEPVVLPGEGLGPIIYFNTYQPPTETNLGPQENPCDAPQEGDMMLYAVSITACAPDIVVGGRESGRLAGGGIHQGTEFVQYIGVGEVGSVPPLDKVIGKKLPYPGGVIFWKEKKR